MRCRGPTACSTGGLLAAALTSCGGGSGADHLPEADHLPGAEAAASCAADPSTRRSRIYVDSRSAVAADCGATMAGTCPTVQKGILACNADGGCDVLVRHGLYPSAETIELREGGTSTAVVASTARRTAAIAPWSRPPPRPARTRCARSRLSRMSSRRSGPSCRRSARSGPAPRSRSRRPLPRGPTRAT